MRQDSVRDHSYLGGARSVASRNVWSAAELQAENDQWQSVCANVFGLEWSR